MRTAHFGIPETPPKRRVFASIHLTYDERRSGTTSASHSSFFKKCSGAWSVS